MEPVEYVNKTYRIQIVDPEIEFLGCLPSTKQNHQETSIPKNSIVKIVDFYQLFNANWFEVEYNTRLYLVTEAQVQDCFMPIHVRTGRTANRR